jgi:hypothetical protein
MATLRNSSQSLYNIGEKPPFVNWTVVRGDTSGFKVYLEDDSKTPLMVSDWTISMKVKRPNTSQLTPIITDDATTIMQLLPEADADDLVGEFTVFLSSSQSLILQTGDIFDIQVSNGEIVWTVCQGSMIILEDVTD